MVHAGDGEGTMHTLIMCVVLLPLHRHGWIWDGCGGGCKWVTARMMADGARG